MWCLSQCQQDPVSVAVEGPALGRWGASCSPFAGGSCVRSPVLRLRPVASVPKAGPALGAAPDSREAPSALCGLPPAPWGSPVALHVPRSGGGLLGGVP